MVIFERKIVTAELVDRGGNAGCREAGQINRRTANGAFYINVENTVYPNCWGCLWMGHGVLPVPDFGWRRKSDWAGEDSELSYLTGFYTCSR
ncbi:hypothetical protein D3C81_1714470 [compost metagenome]